MNQAATLYDGASAQRHEVMVEADGATLRLSGADGWSAAVDGALLTQIDDDRVTLRLGRSDAPGWRLAIAHPVDPAILALVAPPPRYGRWIDRVGLFPALAIGGLVTAAVVTFGYVAPRWLAPHVPLGWERNVGSAIVGDFGDLRCRSPAGQRALEALVERVAPGATKGEHAIKVAALDVPMFNAAALPGGYIVVFKPAITESNVDALAGILAHEVAHVRRRHVTEALLRELGIGALIRLFAGDIGANAEQIVALSYTRDNEAQADADAIAMLRRAGISPQPTAKLFADLAKERDDGLSISAQFLESHPLSRRRAGLFAKSFDPRAPYRPALPESEDNALFDICRDLPGKA